MTTIIYYLGLPPDTLEGHRIRFLKQFKALRQFYLQSSTLQYFKTLIQVPYLDEVNLYFDKLIIFHSAPNHSRCLCETESTEFFNIQRIEPSRHTSCYITKWTCSASSWWNSSSAWLGYIRKKWLFSWFIAWKVCNKVWFEWAF